MCVCINTKKNRHNKFDKQWKIKLPVIYNIKNERIFHEVVFILITTSTLGLLLECWLHSPTLPSFTGAHLHYITKTTINWQCHSGLRRRYFSHAYEDTWLLSAGWSVNSKTLHQRWYALCTLLHAASRLERFAPYYLPHREPTGCFTPFV